MNHGESFPDHSSNVVREENSRITWKQVKLIDVFEFLLIKSSYIFTTLLLTFFFIWSSAIELFLYIIYT